MQGPLRPAAGDRFQADLERARRVYGARDLNPANAERYEPIAPTSLFRRQERDWILARLLRESGLGSLAGLDVMEVGCGSGASLRDLVSLGADAGRLAGIDLMEDRIAAARRRFPAGDFRVGSAHQLPFEDAAFDVISQMTLFSSVVEPDLRAVIAQEMLRTLRPNGRILWYEVERSRPTPDLVPISGAELARLFPNCRILRRPVTLRWWLLERVVPRSRLAGQLLAMIPGLCSHVIAVIQPT